MTDFQTLCRWQCPGFEPCDRHHTAEQQRQCSSFVVGTIIWEEEEVEHEKILAIRTIFETQLLLFLDDHFLLMDRDLHLFSFSQNIDHR